MVLPDNGPSWHKLRSNDFSDVDLSRLSPPLVSLIAIMLEKSPDHRISIFDVQSHSVVSSIHAMLLDSLRLAEEGSSTPAMKGATAEEGPTFMEQVFAIAYPASSTPPATIPSITTASAEVGMDLD